MELLGDVGLWNLVSVCLDRCTVFAKHLTGSEIILDIPDVLPGDEAQVEARFSLFGDSGNLDAR
jgi:hypothetical protein